MSNRDSLGFGDLLPQDVVHVFAQERHNKRGRKKRSNSLGRALGWLKGKKRKDLGSSGQNPGLGPALDLALDGHPAGYQGAHRGGPKGGKPSHPHGNSHAAPKRDDDDKAVAPPLLQENVFIETSRPKYLEDLHTEALEGLKMMQQEESNYGEEFQDNESTISTVTVQTDGESAGFTTDSTIPDTSSVVSAQSSVSTRSSRSGLTRQASTFRPLNSGKRSDKAKRRHRRTVGGIPQHVRREMGLDREGWKLTPKFEEQFYNGETDSSTASNGPGSAGASASLQDIKIIKPLNKHQVEQLSAPHAGHRDDLALLPRLSHDVSDEQRPRSLAVPWMTTANSLQPELPGPVITASPQAAYMSKIIPNAVLPPSIEVVEISRGRSRSSLRTVSKSSLLPSSPAPSRASSRASSSRTTSSKASTITSASRYNPAHLSDSSCWSNSESSDTLVSDSSTISSSTTPRQKTSQDGDASAREDRISVHSSVSKASKCAANGRTLSKVDEVKKDAFVRSLSVMKPKRAPPPPSRSYSLHNKMKRRSRDLPDIRVVTGESSPKKFSLAGKENKSQHSPVSKVDSPSYHADTSSLDDSTGSGSFSPFRSQLQTLNEEKAAKAKEAATAKQNNKLSKVISPSSGYSSQDAMSPPSASPKTKNGILEKLKKLFPSPSSAGSAPSPEKTKATGDLKSDSVDAVGVSPSVRMLRDLFDIPPPPKVHAPPPPPPEVWAHSKRSVELLLGPPVPENLYAIIKKNPKDRRQQRQPAEGSVSGAAERKHKTPVEPVNGSVAALETKMLQESRTMNAQMHKENNERLAKNAKKTSAHAADVKAPVDPPPTISLERISQSPSPSPLAVHHPPQPPREAHSKVETGQTVLSPDSCWPAPPPPTMAQVGVGGPDEVDLPPPPPPQSGGVSLVIPVQVPSDKSSSSQGGALPALTIPPPPPYTAPPPPLAAASPATTKKVSVPSKDAFPPPPEEFAQQPATRGLTTAPEGLTPTPAAAISAPPPPSTPPPPPPASIVLTPPPTVVIPPAPPPSSTVVSPPAPPPTAVSAPLPPPTEVSPPPPPKISTSASTDVSHVRPKEPLVLDQVVKVESPSPVQEVIPQVPALVSSGDAPPVNILEPPSSVPAPPPPPAQPQSSKEGQDITKSNPDSGPVSGTDIPTPPQSVPPPPPPSIEVLHQPVITECPSTQVAPISEVSVQPTVEVSAPAQKVQEPVPPPPEHIPVPPPLHVQGNANAMPHPNTASPENQNQEPSPVLNTAQKEEPAPIITPSLLQKVKLRSVNSTEPPSEQPQAEVTLRQKVPGSEVQASSAGGDTPQKPIRRSLIVTSPPSTTPPAVNTSQPAPPKSQSPAGPAVSTAPSSSKKPPNTSMNLQEAIRLRTAGRSKESPSSRLSLNSPTSPIDPHRSPSSTASFIFSKSNKKPASDMKAAAQNNREASSATKVGGEAENLKTGAKVPPPVAKKPKAKEMSEEMERTAGQEEEQDNKTDDAVRTNGTAGTVEGETAST